MQRPHAGVREPEQIRGELVSTATDVYSLAVVLYISSRAGLRTVSWARRRASWLTRSRARSPNGPAPSRRNSKRCARRRLHSAESAAEGTGETLLLSRAVRGRHPPPSGRPSCHRPEGDLELPRREVRSPPRDQRRGGGARVPHARRRHRRDAPRGADCGGESAARRRALQRRAEARQLASLRGARFDSEPSRSDRRAQADPAAVAGIPGQPREGSRE